MTYVNNVNVMKNASIDETMEGRNNVAKPNNTTLFS
jgi:hypothetical protein